MSKTELDAIQHHYYNALCRDGNGTVILDGHTAGLV